MTVDEKLASVRGIVDLSPDAALDEDEAFLTRLGYMSSIRYVEGRPQHQFFAASSALSPRRQLRTAACLNRKMRLSCSRTSG